MTGVCGGVGGEFKRRVSRWFSKGICGLEAVRHAILGLVGNQDAGPNPVLSTDVNLSCQQNLLSAKSLISELAIQHGRRGTGNIASVNGKTVCDLLTRRPHIACGCCACVGGVVPEARFWLMLILRSG